MVHVVCIRRIKAVNRTELLTINTGTTVVGLCTNTTVMLFDPCLQDHFWKYDNHGLKLLQLRFYAASAGGGGG